MNHVFEVDSIRKKLSSKKKKKGHSQEGIKNLQPVEKPGEVKRKFATKESLSTRVRHKKTNVNQIQTQNQNQDTAPPKEPATLRVKKTAEKKCQPIPEVKGKKDSDDIKEEQQSEKLEKTTADDIVNVNPNVDTPTPTPTSTPINNNPTTDIFQKNCLTWVQKIIKKRIVAIQNEFLVEKGYLPRKKCEVFVRNEKKNRYGDVICTDSTRVILKNREPDDDYIHASWVQSPFPNSQKYICAQGPMTETVNDFWHMIFQEHVTVIVMLCNFDEMGFEKCAVYWPLEVGQTSNYEEYYVKNEKIETCEVENVKVTTLSVHAGRSKDEYLTIRHYQWPGWPDHMAPGDPAPCVTLLSMVKARSKNDPILVHCSAGIGRTGTFCGIDYTYDRIRIKPEIEMKQILRELRNQRIHSIQSAPQYIY
uniref:Uncharacterized protein n=1 Tax=Panagrolaimus sp. JU765 TaxID=591449 RepID=A0AC34R1J6_9BILA